MEAASLRSAILRGSRPSRSKSQPRNRIPRDRARTFFSYVGLVVALAVVGVVLSVQRLPAEMHNMPAAFWVIAVLAVVVDIRPFHAPGREPDATVFTSIAFTFALLLGWGLAPAVAVQSAAVVVSSVRLRHAPWRALFNAAQYGLAFCAANLVLAGFGEAVPIHVGVSASSALAPLAVVAILAAAVSWFVVNELLVTTGVWLAFGGRWRTALTGTARQETLSTLGLLALGPLVAAAGNVSALFVPLTLVPLYAVSELARFSDQERRKALRDDLTQLPNRRALFGELRNHVRHFTERFGRLPDDPRRMALLLLDIDQFRRVNDALGHTVGDRLLGAVADRLTDAVGTDGLVARLGGDEFGVLRTAAGRSRRGRRCWPSGWPTR